jgi:hypothetical protein
MAPKPQTKCHRQWHCQIFKNAMCSLSSAEQVAAFTGATKEIWVQADINPVEPAGSWC